MMHNQRDFQLRFEWGPQGLTHLAPIRDALVIVDLLAFSTPTVVAALTKSALDTSGLV